MAAANDGLVGVVGVDVEAAADEDPRQDVAGGGDALARRAANADGKVDSAHGSSPVRSAWIILTSAPRDPSPGETASAAAAIPRYPAPTAGRGQGVRRSRRPR